jgi:16S rRNA (cytidine1402-2'-O)-methyltransferase
LVALVGDLEADGLTRKDAIVEAARRAGVPKREVYDLIHRDRA